MSHLIGLTRPALSFITRLAAVGFVAVGVAFIAALAGSGAASAQSKNVGFFVDHGMGDDDSDTEGKGGSKGEMRVWRLNAPNFPARPGAPRSGDSVVGITMSQVRILLEFRQGGNTYLFEAYAPMSVATIFPDTPEENSTSNFGELVAQQRITIPVSIDAFKPGTCYYLNGKLYCP
jgi:hypothetical protein